MNGFLPSGSLFFKFSRGDKRAAAVKNTIALLGGLSHQGGSPAGDAIPIFRADFPGS